MRLLLDTHILVGAMAEPTRLPRRAAHLIADETAEKLFSVASIWEVAIKYALRRPNFAIDPADLAAAARVDLTEIVVTSAAAARVATLPLLHRDPFDRLLAAQAIEEDACLLTVDAALSAHGRPVLVLDR